MPETLAAIGLDPAPAEAPRDRGLDAVRVLALALMVAAHHSWSVPVSTASGDAFQFLGNTAPAFFFFAFGMTFDRFLRKDRKTQIGRCLLFLWVALAHNLLVAQMRGRYGLLHTDFLFVLWLCLVVLLVVEIQLRPTPRTYALVLGVGTALLVFTPWGHSIQALLEKGIPGEFQLYPWGLFVIAGLLFSRSSQPRRAALAAAVAVAVGVALVALDRSGYGLDGWALTRRPMSGPYFLILCGLSVSVVSVLRRTSASSAPSRTVVFLSSNLLLCTVLHYVPVSIVGALSGQIAGDESAATVFGRDSSYIIMWLGAGVCIALLSPLTLGVLKAWEHIRDARVVQAGRARLAFTAFAALAAAQTCLFMACDITSRSASGAYLPAWVVSLTPTVTGAVIVTAMAYAALEMREFSLGRRR